jgi:hypothetical protein
MKSVIFYYHNKFNWPHNKNTVDELCCFSSHMLCTCSEWRFAEKKGMAEFFSCNRLAELWMMIEKLHLSYLHTDENLSKIEQRGKLEGNFIFIINLACGCNTWCWRITLYCFCACVYLYMYIKCERQVLSQSDRRWI